MLAYSQFVSGNKLVSPHHVAVLEIKGEYALILPTVSIDVEANRAHGISGEVSSRDLQLAGWKNRCKWEITALQWVPVAWISERPGARLSPQTNSELRLVAKRFGPAAPRHHDEITASLTLRSVRKNKERIAVAV